MRGISTNQRNSIIALLKNGESVRELAKRVGVSPATTKAEFIGNPQRHMESHNMFFFIQ